MPRTTKLQLRATPEERLRWQALADRMGLPLAEVTRRCLNMLAMADPGVPAAPRATTRAVATPTAPLPVTPPPLLRPVPTTPTVVRTGRLKNPWET